MSLNAEILAVGTELLLGDTINSNAAYLAKELSKLGINVFFQSVVGDNWGRIHESLEAAYSRADLVITTGGLGPTADDMTKEAAAAFFGVKMVTDEVSLKKLKGHFEKMNRAMTPNNLKQADIPEGAVALNNDRGTAPGILLEKDERIIIMLPGPPFEMKHVFETHVAPYLRQKSEFILHSVTLNLSGIGESQAESMVSDILESQDNPTIAPYAKASGVIFRITARAKNEQEAMALIAPVKARLYERLGEFVVGEDEDKLWNVVFKKLLAANKTLAVAESCTGGMLLERLTSIPGASNVLVEGLVTYSNQSKIKRLGVSSETIEKWGAVSSECALEMAKGVRETSGADFGLSITGIAGPDGGTPEKPVGLVYVGLSTANGEEFVELKLNGDRERIRTRAVMSALDLVRKAIK